MKRKGLLAVCLIFAFAFFGCENPVTETEETALTWGYTITGKVSTGGIPADWSMAKLQLFKDNVAVSAYVRPKSDGTFEFRHLDAGAGYVIKGGIDSLVDGELSFEGETTAFDVSEDTAAPDITLTSTTSPQIVSIHEFIPSQQTPELRIVFSQFIKAENANGFSITVDSSDAVDTNAAAVTVQSVAVDSVDGYVLKMTLSRPFAPAEKYKVSYDAETGGIKNLSDKAAVNYNSEEITLRVEFLFDDIYWTKFKMAPAAPEMYAVVLKTTKNMGKDAGQIIGTLAQLGFTISYSGGDLKFYGQKWPGTQAGERSSDWIFVLQTGSFSEDKELKISYDPTARSYQATDKTYLGAFTDVIVSKKP